ncbi:hypothetical protein ATX60_10215 [Oenococcus oeni]|uniref:hypothetical protein n=1 Tax=Oenococcus oeni TaxID=1247 RepID=UPI0008F958C3|nr:hypothetical protein [Oenococcus oeni]OIM22297.1 hypothetical protein ATX60_10215 [Oenococcus oeni]
MKKLNSFEKFDLENFLKEKTLLVMNSSVLTDYDSGKEIGSKYRFLIWQDNTTYVNGEKGINGGESFNVKVLDKAPKEIKKPTPAKIISGIGKLYGDYRSELSITAKDIVLINSDNKEVNE